MNIERQDQMPEYASALTERTQSIIQKMKARPLIEGGDAAALEERKVHIEHVLRRTGEHAPKLLDAFEEIAKKHLGSGILFREIALFIVGGNAHGGDFRETSDVDIVFAADPSLDPLARDAIITYPQRAAIGKDLYLVIKQLFSKDSEHESFSEGDVEIKGFGDQTPNELRERETSTKDVARLLSKVWPTR